MYGAEPDGLCAVVPCGSATAPVFCEASTSVFGAVDEIPTFPFTSIRSLSPEFVTNLRSSSNNSILHSVPVSTLFLKQYDFYYFEMLQQLMEYC